MANSQKGDIWINDGPVNLQVYTSVGLGEIMIAICDEDEHSAHENDSCIFQIC